MKHSYKIWKKFLLIRKKSWGKLQNIWEYHMILQTVILENKIHLG